MFAETLDYLGLIHVGTTAPASPTTGDAWLRKPMNMLQVFDGTAWVAAGTASVGSGNPVVSGLAHDSSLDLTLTDGTVIKIDTKPITDGGRY